MSVLHCEVNLDNPRTIYEPGYKLTGRVILTLDVRLLLKAIFLEYSGYADVHCQILEKSKKRKTETSVLYTNREDFQSKINYFVGSEEATPRIIESGTYVYPFSVDLPENCPSSFECPYGHIRYLIEVFIEHKNKRELWYTQELRVLKTLDLRQNPQLTVEPYEVRIEEKSFFKLFTVPMQMIVNLQKGVFHPGEMISIHITIHNPSKLQLHEVSYELQQIFRITAAHGYKKTKTKYFYNILQKTAHNFVGSRELMMQNLESLLLPSDAVPTTDPADCHCFQISYELNVRLGTNNLKRWLQAKVPITVGTESLGWSVGDGPRASQGDLWHEKLMPHSVGDLSTRRISADRQSEYVAATATAPTLETRRDSVSMMSLASSSFREAEYMPKTKIDAEAKKTKQIKDDTDFKPKYLYYDMSRAPLIHDAKRDSISSIVSGSNQNERSTTNL